PRREAPRRGRETPRDRDGRHRRDHAQQEPGGEARQERRRAREREQRPVAPCPAPREPHERRERGEETKRRREIERDEPAMRESFRAQRIERQRQDAGATPV